MGPVGWDGQFTAFLDIYEVSVQHTYSLCSWVFWKCSKARCSSSVNGLRSEGASSVCQKAFSRSSLDWPAVRESRQGWICSDEVWGMILPRMDHPNTVSQAWRVRSSEDHLPGSITSSRISEPSSISILPGWSKLGSARDNPCRKGWFFTPLRWNPGRSLVIF